jgi:acyl carrier protein
MMGSSTQAVTADQIKELIVNLLVDEFDIESGRITDEATLESLELDSLDMVEIGQIVDQRYGVRIKGSDAEDVIDIGGVVQMICKKIDGANPDADGGDEETK